MKPVRKNSIVVLFLLMIAFSILSCNQKKIDREDLVKIYVENLIAVEKYSFSADSLKLHTENVYRKFNTSKEEYEAELANYAGDVEMWNSFFGDAKEYLNELKGKGIIN